MKTFHESQKLNSLLAWLPLIAAFLFMVYALWQQLVMGTPIGNAPAPNAVLIACTALVVGIMITLAVMELKTEITAEGISARFLPFGKAKYFWSEVDYFTIENPNVKGIGVKYNPMTKMKYFNTNFGDMLILHLKDGKKFGLGTKKPAEMNAFLNELFLGGDKSDLLQNIQDNRERIELREERDDQNFV